MPTTSRGFRYPASSAAPNVPQDIQNLATDLDTFLTPQQWAIAVASAGGTANVTGTAFGIVSGYGPFSVGVVPTGRYLEVEFTCPIVDVPTGTGIQLRLVIGGTVEDAGYWSNSGATSYAVRGALKGVKAGTGASVSYQLEALKVGSGTPRIGTDVTGSKISLRHRIV